jgi:hypothetical protein
MPLRGAVEDLPDGAEADEGRARRLAAGGEHPCQARGQLGGRRLAELGRKRRRRLEATQLGCGHADHPVHDA